MPAYNIEEQKEKIKTHRKLQNTAHNIRKMHETA